MNGEPERPDPDRLLEAVEREAERARRGKLRIFFGASAGVGKTYAMLEAALETRRRGVDVVVGYVEPHGRRDTERLLQGLDQLQPLLVSYAGRDPPRVRPGCRPAADARPSRLWTNWLTPTSRAAPRSSGT